MQRQITDFIEDLIYLIFKLPRPFLNLAKSFFIHVILHLSLGCHIAGFQRHASQNRSN